MNIETKLLLCGKGCGFGFFHSSSVVHAFSDSLSILLMMLLSLLADDAHVFITFPIPHTFLLDCYTTVGLLVFLI